MTYGPQPVVSQNPANSIPNVFNFSPTSLPRYRAKLARAIAGGVPVKIAMIGDSTTAGLGSGSGGTQNLNGAKATAYPAQLAKLFNGAGLTANVNSMWGNNALAAIAAPSPYDPSLSFAGSGVWSAGPTALGGAMFLNSTTTDALSYTPTTSTDSIDVYYVQSTGFATFTVKDGSTTLGTPNAAGTAAFIKASFTRTVSANAINLARTGTGAQLYVAGIDTWNSTTDKVKVLNMGISGTQSNGYLANTQTWDFLKSILVVSPDVVVIDLGINDVRNNVAAATYQSNVQTVITTLQTGGIDVVLLRYNPDNSPVNPGLLPAYQGAQYALAAANNIPLIDLTARYGSYATMNAQGDYFDAVHQTAQGYSDFAMSLWQILRPQ